jgi:hypothetical protein
MSSKHRPLFNTGEIKALHKLYNLELALNMVRVLELARKQEQDGQQKPQATDTARR